MLEVQYSRILLIGSVVVLLRSCLSAFFTGIGDTRIIMIASVVGLCVNIPLNYIFIFGKFGMLALGIQGAAIATVISGTVMGCILLVKYCNAQFHRDYQTRIFLKLDKENMKKLVIYGVPAGAEAGISMSAYSGFLLAMSSYGPLVGSAVSIVLSWEEILFLPMLGLSFASTALIGQYMGTRNIQGVMRIFYITVVSMMVVVGSSFVFFLGLPEYLIHIFSNNMENFNLVFSLSKTLMGFLPFVLFFDGLSLAFDAVLRGSGDTKGILFVYAIVDILVIGAAIFFVFSQRATPVQAWFIYLFFAVGITTGSCIRFFQKRWKYIALVESSSEVSLETTSVGEMRENTREEK